MFVKENPDRKKKKIIILSATSGGVSTVSFVSIVGVPVGISSASFFYCKRNNKNITGNNGK